MTLMQELLDNPVAATFAIIVVGSLIGRIRLAGLCLGSGGVLFAALAFGHWHLVDPEAFGVIGSLGVVLFVYAIGLQAGPRFVQTLIGKGKLLVQIALATIVGAALCAAVAGRLLGADTTLIVGIFAGAMTSTPALAAAIEVSGDPRLSVAYGLAYPIGVIGVVLVAQIAPRILQVRRPTEPEDADDQESNALEKRAFCLNNPSLFGQTLAELRLHEMVHANVSRILRGDQTLFAAPDQNLEQGDVVVAVGEPGDLARLALLIGPEVGVEPRRETDIVARDIVITENAVIGKRLHELRFPARYGITLTRVRRETLEFAPSGNFILELGDQVRVVGPKQDVETMVKQSGIHERRLHETGLPAFSLGFVLGVILGLLPIPVPWGGSVRLGLAGGPLFAGLLFGHFGRIGGVHIHVPPAARYLMRELGLLLFLVSAGTAAGAEMLPILRTQGIPLVLLAVLTVTVALAIGILLAYGLFKQNAASTLGMTCGAMTSTPGLGAVTAQFDSDTPALSYAAVYPIALVGMTIVAQILVAVL